MEFSGKSSTIDAAEIQNRCETQNEALGGTDSGPWQRNMAVPV